MVVLPQEGHGESQMRDGHTCWSLASSSICQWCQGTEREKAPCQEEASISLLSISGPYMCPLSAVLNPEPALRSSWVRLGPGASFGLLQVGQPIKLEQQQADLWAKHRASRRVLCFKANSSAKMMQYALWVPKTRWDRSLPKMWTCKLVKKLAVWSVTPEVQQEQTLKSTAASPCLVYMSKGEAEAQMCMGRQLIRCNPGYRTA